MQVTRPLLQVKPAPFVRAAPFVRPSRPQLRNSNKIKILGKTERGVAPVTEIVIKSTSKHPALLENFRGQKVVDSFSDLYLRDDVVSALKEIGVTKPTIIQMLAIPKIGRGKNVLCAAETGSGKTLAYLAPLVSRLKDEEDQLGVLTRLTRPRALIVLPTRDLAAQVLQVAKSLCHQTKFRAVGLIGGMRRKRIREGLVNPVDIAVATPDALLKHKERDRVLFSDITHLVLDEADTLFHHTFKEATMSILKAIKVRSKKPPVVLTREEGAQVTIVGATLSQDLLSEVEKLVPSLKKISSKHLHQVLPHVEQRFITVKQSEKAAELLSLINSNPSDNFMIFCNTVPCCDFVSRHLEHESIDVVRLHGGFSAINRKNLLKKFEEGSSKVLVCTDIASRGIDSGKVNHIILFDFPLNLPDYLHRVGRTGRVGSKVTHPRVTAFMSHRKDVQMAWKIKNASTKQEAIMDKKAVHKIQTNNMDNDRRSRTTTEESIELKRSALK